MSRIGPYTGNVDLINGLRRKNNGDFFLVDSPDVRTGDGISLQDSLEDMIKVNDSTEVATKINITTTNEDIDLITIQDLKNIIAEEFTTNKTYAIGQYVLYEGNLYKFIAVHNAGNWDDGQVRQIKIGDEVDGLKTQIAYNAESQELVFTDGGYIPLSSVGSESTFTPTSSSICSYLIAECNAGDIFDVWGDPLTVSASIQAMRTAAFYDTNRICVTRFSTRPTMNGVRFIASVDGYFVCNVYTPTAHKVYKNSINIKAAINNDERNLNNLMLRYGEGADVVSTVINNIVNNIEYPYGEELTNYNTHIFNVNGGDLFEITGLMIPTYSKYAIAMFYNDNNFVGFKPKPSNYDSSNKYIIVVPENANKMTLSMAGSNHYTIKKIAIKDAEYNVSINNGKVSIKTNNFIFEMNKHGNNNLFDLLSVKKADGTLIKQFSTDWQGPFVAYALHNVDGDWSSSCHTGGNHAYPNPDADHPTGTPTGRTAIIHVYADGAEINEGEEAVWNDNVTVEWVNYVQAWNTMKADGTGREAIKENPKWIFKKDGTVTVSNFITALEDIMVSTYYGMQEACGWMNRGFFAPGASRKIVNMSVFTSTGLGTRFAGENTIVFDDNLTLEMAFNNAIDLGTGIGINSDSIKETRLHTNTSKAYFYMMYNMSLNSDENACYEGYYKFVKP